MLTFSVASAVHPVESAKSAGLHYLRDDTPGIRRVTSGNAFRYLAQDGEFVRDPQTLARIRSLAIPPAWKDVWICPRADGHLQATGRDARGRKQYRYHPDWRGVRDETKYHRMIAFAEALPAIKQRVAHDLALPGLPRHKVLATIVGLLEKTLVRIGNTEYVRQNGSFGLTTLRDEHVAAAGSTLRLEFRGKSGKQHVIDVNDRRLARIVRQCQALPGQELFQYVDDQARRHPIGSADVNAYLRDITGCDFTAKDFRTWAGTVLAVRALQEFGSFRSATQAKRQIAAAIAAVAEQLGNTKAVCRKCYVHPSVLEAFLDGSLPRRRPACVGEASPQMGLSTEEEAVLKFLKKRV